MLASDAEASWRLEDRGEVRGGHSVVGFLGEQFALPVALESLRAARHLEPTGEIVTLSAADPLNLVGIIVPGVRVPAISRKTITLRDGAALECGPLIDLAGASERRSAAFSRQEPSDLESCGGK